MWTRTLHKAKPLLKYFPGLDRFVKRRDRRRQFKTEWELIRRTHQNDNAQPSIIHFSINKAATQYIKSILTRCAVETGMVPVRIHEYAFDTDFPFLDHLSAKEMSKYHHIFKRKGYLYSVFGGMIEGIPLLDQYKIVLVVRDPRDLLVSNYYSIAYSHVVPSEEGNKHKTFLEKRMYAKESAIDEYVISESDKLYNIFMRYQDLLLNKYTNTYLTTYENMVADFGEWLNRLVNYCELDISKALFQSLLEENERIKPKEENINKHMRKGHPGDYKEKLKLSTIQQLNTKFASIFEKFGYDQKQPIM